MTRVVSSLWFWLSLVFLVAGFNIARAVLRAPPAPLPVLGSVPMFSLLDQSGAAFGSADLQGKAWVANFIFTRCPTVCPAFSAKMAQIQHRSRGLGDALRLISFSVDPEYDSPAVLHDYARQYKARSIWHFLTGALDPIKQVVTDGLKIAMGNDDVEGNFAGIFHGSHFVLVDGRGQIRGYYDASDEGAVDRVLAALGQLANS
jgi:protein SCO1/2